jgi:hypothetical protein
MPTLDGDSVQTASLRLALPNVYAAQSSFFAAAKVPFTAARA